jgi:hypothetical protein
LVNPGKLAHRFSNSVLADKFLYQIQISYEEMGLYDFARAIERAHGIGESND